MGKKRARYNDHPCVRIASIDIGGGTTDLSITTYELASGEGDTARIVPHTEFRDGYLAAPIALFVRLLVQPRLDIRTGQCGTTAPKGSSGQPAADTPLRARQQALRTEARTLLRRASEYLSDHRDEFPEYDPARDILKRCSTDGCLVQIR